MNVVSFGGGTNSTAMLIGMHERGIAIDLILFSDTGGEKPHTYAHIAEMSAWLVAHGMPAIEVIKGQQPKQLIDGSLESECLRRKALPSIAFGFKTCSQKWKVAPQDVFLKSFGVTEYFKYIGFDADEPQRAKPYLNNRYPLIEWNWGRAECIEAIDRAGLTRPGKSACFFCPSSKKAEIYALKKEYPLLFDRAVAMERNAELTSVVGLGRSFSWDHLVNGDPKQSEFFPESRIDIDCGCYDGEP